VPFVPGVPRFSPQAYAHHEWSRALNQEIKRRTRVVRIFPNRTSYLRLVSALAVEQSEEWLTGRRYPDMRKLEQPWHQERETKEVALV
jgi:transposase-like protein